jgi:hypothetical protein
MPGAGEAGRYVATKAIREAVRGRETDILDALGIAWRDGLPHIQCPYPDHHDRNPSWRFDPRNRRAICTCITERKSDGIFDIMMKMRSVDFDAAKVIVAELLHRDDLIRTRGGNNGGQKTDPQSLLNPPADNRDDGLVGRYLGGRLGVDANQIPLPSTQSVGIISLAYFDPPLKNGKAAKPVLVGNWPGVVFETVAADGRSHAHRIYLNSAGDDKADLGVDANGKQRDPKKSARRDPQGPSTAGCCVVWGNPDVEHVILAEGPENAAAITYSFRDEIAKGERAVLSAINAGGIEAFVPWPSTRCITICADRDEEKPDVGFKRGEQAARSLVLKLVSEAIDGCPQLQTLIALPGQSGTKYDVLDLFRAKGPDGVRTLIAGAVPFVPTQKEIDDFKNRGSRRDEIAEIERAFPLPRLLTTRLDYRRTGTDEIWVHKFLKEVTDKDTGETSEIWWPISSPFTVPACLQLADAGNGYAMRIQIADRDGATALIDFDRGDLARLAASEIKARLLHAGLRVANGGELDIIDILKEITPPALISAFSHSGWHRLTEWCFIAPGGQVIGAPEFGRQVELFGRLPNTQAGSFADWREAIASAVGEAGCPHWTLGAAAGFAGPLIDLLGIETHGINLSGPTSRGKTTAQRLGVSAWSSPKPGAGLLQSMRTTENAIEILARQSYGTILALDELAHVAGRVIGRIIYLLSGNVGKARMTSGGTLRPLVTWSTFALTSGEQALEQKIRDDDGQWSSGMAVRFCNVDVSTCDAKVARTTLNKIETIADHHGHAGLAFVEKVIAEGWHHRPDPVRQLIVTEAEALAGDGADSARVRAAMPLAIVMVAGAAAVAFGILPQETDINGAGRWAWEQFASSREAEALDVERRVLANLRLWVAERWDATIKRNTLTDLNTRDALAWYDEYAVYIPTARIAEAAGDTLSAPAIGNLLDRRDLLARRDNARRVALKRVPLIGRVQNYALKRSEFGRPK